MSKLDVIEGIGDIFAKWLKADKEAQAEAVKRLGLPKNNTAKDRAKAMGFGDTQYHGRYSDYDDIDPSKSFYTTTDPEYASIYTNPNASSMGGKTATDFKDIKPNVMPLRIQNSQLLDTRTPQGKKLFEKEFFNQYGNSTPLTDKGLPDWTDAEDFGYMFDEKNMPYKGVLVDEKGTLNIDGSIKDRGVSTRVFDPTAVRSKFAHFNPKMAGVGAGSVLSADLMANENNKGNMSNTFFDDINAKAEARRNMSWDRQQRLINSGLMTPSLTNGSMDNSLTDEQKQAKKALIAKKKRQAYSELMALPVGMVEGAAGILGDVELLGQGIKGAYNADSGNRWEGFKEGLSDRDTMFWSTLDNQERTDGWLEGTEFGDRLKEGAGGRLVGEILAPIPTVPGIAKAGKFLGLEGAKQLADTVGTGIKAERTPGLSGGIGQLLGMSQDPAMVIGRNSKVYNKASDKLFKTLEKQGKTPDEIWAATAKKGNPTYRDVDGYIKQEIPTGEMKLRDRNNVFSKKNKKKEVSKKNAIANEALESYPQSKNINLIRSLEKDFAEGAGAQFGKDIKVGQSSLDDLNNLKRSNLLTHEGQHFIQGQEGWARGSNPNMFPSSAEINQYQQRIRDTFALNQKGGDATIMFDTALKDAKVSPENIEKIREYLTKEANNSDVFIGHYLDTKDIQKATGVKLPKKVADDLNMKLDAEGWDFEGTNLMPYDLQNINSMNMQIKDKLGNRVPDLYNSPSDMSKYLMYENSPGEIMARASQKRAPLGREAIAKDPIWNDYEPFSWNADEYPVFNPDDIDFTSKTFAIGAKDGADGFVDWNQKMPAMSLPKKKLMNSPVRDGNPITGDLNINDAIARKPRANKIDTADELDYFEALQEDKFFNKRKELNAPRVNAEGTDNLSYKVRDSDYAFGNSNGVVDSDLMLKPKPSQEYIQNSNSMASTNPNGVDRIFPARDEGKFPKDKYIKPGEDSFYDSIYKSQNQYGDLVDYDAKKVIERQQDIQFPFESPPNIVNNRRQPSIWDKEFESIFGKQTGSGKIGANKRVNPDLGLTYDGLDGIKVDKDGITLKNPNATRLEANGQPAKTTQPPTDKFGNLTDEAFDIVEDAKGNPVRQPKGGFNIRDMSAEDLQRALDKELEVPNARGIMPRDGGKPTVTRNLNDYTDSLDMKTNSVYSQKGEFEISQKNIDEAIRNADKSDTHFTGDTVDFTSPSAKKKMRDVELATVTNKIADLVEDTVPAALNKPDRVVNNKTIRAIDDYFDNIKINEKTPEGKIKAEGKIKTLQDLANNKIKDLDTKLNTLTTMLTDMQQAIPGSPKTVMNSTSINKVIDAIHHTMFDAFEQAYKTNNIDTVAKTMKNTKSEGIFKMDLSDIKNQPIPTSPEHYLKQLQESVKLVPRKGGVMKRSPNFRKQKIDKEPNAPYTEGLPEEGRGFNNGIPDENDYEGLQNIGNQGYNDGAGSNTFKNQYTPEVKKKLDAIDAELEELKLMDEESIAKAKYDNPETYAEYEFDEFLRSWEKEALDRTTKTRHLPKSRIAAKRKKAGGLDFISDKNKTGNLRGDTMTATDEAELMPWLQDLPDYSAGRGRTGNVSSRNNDSFERIAKIKREKELLRKKEEILEKMRQYQLKQGLL